MKRYFIGFIVTIGLIVLLIVLLFSGGSKPKATVTPKTLTSYANTDATVRLTIDGPINAQQTHNQVQITVDREDAQFALLQGYNGSVIKSQTYANTENAYDAFLHALEHAGFTEGNTASGLSDESGYCPTGDRYIFELMNNDQDLERYWTTSCGGTPKTFGGKLNLNLTLFEQQIPTYQNLVGTANI
jgi:hypothetical protein